MGKVSIKLKVSKARPGTVEVEALVDTGALNPSVIKSLGLEKVDDLVSQTPNGPKQRAVYEPVRLDLQGRYGNFDVVGIGENVPNLLGQIPLAYLDCVVDSKSRKLNPNPEHGDKQMSEGY